MKKHLYLSTIVIFSLMLLLTGCGIAGLEGEKVAKEPINRDEWPTPLPAKPVASPTPFPKVQLPATATPTPRPAVESPQPTPVLPTTALTPVSAPDAGNLMQALAGQVGPLAGLSPVAVGFILNDNTSIRQGPGGWRCCHSE